MRQLLTLGLLCLSFLAHSQIDWKSYKESDNTIKNFFAISNINHSMTSINSDLFGSIGAQYSSRKVKELSITNLSLTSQYFVNFEELENINYAVGFNLNHSHYFDHRRGLFIEGTVSGTYQISRNSFSGTNFGDTHRARLQLGYGRMENISRVYQAVRIAKSQSGGALDQEKIFSMSDALSQINFNDAFDNKSVDSEKQAAFISSLEGQGYDLSSAANQLAALSNLNYEIPNVLRQGMTARLGIEVIGSFQSESTNTRAIFNYDYATALNDKWHLDIGTQVEHIFGDTRNNGIVVSTQLSYIPTARTRISFGNSFSYGNSSISNSIGNTTSISASYAVSQNASVFGNLAYNYNRIAGTFFAPNSFDQLISGIGVRINF